MANYTKTTDFAAKDTLPGGDTNKVVRGAEFETEFDAISTAIATKSDTAGPTFTGTVTIPTADINGGNIDGTVIGASTAAAGTFTNLVVTSADINGGTVDGATIGGSSAGAGTFTNLTASGTVNFSGATISNLGTITTANLDGGTVDNSVIGGATPAAGTFTDLTANTSFTSGNVDINGGAIDGTVIGASSAAAGTFAAVAGTTGTFSGAVTGSNLNVSNWDTAFGWGNHASAGYLTSVGFSDIAAGAVTLSSETFSDVDNQIPTNAAVIDYVAATIPLISEVNDLSTVVTWATVPDAFISASSVNQHVSVEKATQSKTYTLDETATLTLSSSISSGVPVVSVTKEVPQTGVTNNAWDAAAGSYTLEDSAYATTLDFAGDLSSASFVDSFSIASQETSPRGLAFSTDGTKMFVLGTSGDDVNEYTLSTGFDVSTASFVDSFSVSSQEDNPWGLAFNSDGTKMFVTGLTGVDVNEYDLSTAFDVSTASYSQNFSISSETSTPRGITFSSNGSKMFIVDYSSSAIDEYDLSTGFDISTSSYSQTFSVSSQATEPLDVSFNSSGTKMFVVGQVSDSVHEYALSTGFDISTASFVESLSVASEETSPSSLAFNADGSKMFVLGSTGDDVNEYSLPLTLQLGTGSFASTDVGKTINVNDGVLLLTATDGSYEETTAPTSTDQAASGEWSMTSVVYDASADVLKVSGTLTAQFDVSTASYSQSFSVAAQETTPNGIAFNVNGTKMFIVGSNGDDVNEYTLSTAFDVSTSTFVDSFSISAQETNPQDIKFNADGTKMFILGSSGDDVNEYTLSTGFDVSTASFVDSFSVSAQDSFPTALAFSTDGTKMFIVGSTGDDVNEYTLSTGFDVSTASFVDSFSVSAQETTPRGLDFSADGTKMYVVGTTGDAVYEYALTTGFDVSTASFTDSFSTSAQETFPTGIAFNTDGTKMFIVGQIGTAVYEYSVGVEAVPTGYQPAISNNIDTTFWADINSLTATNAIGDGNVFYAVSNDARDSWSVLDNTDGVRDIVKNNAGTWQYNSNTTYGSETWTNATTNTEVSALREAMEGASNAVGYQLSSASYDSVSFSVSSQDSSPKGISFNSDGTKMFVVGQTGDSVYEYALTTGFDVSTASYSQSFSVSSQDANPRGITFNSDGTKMFVVGYAESRVNEYDLTTGFDISTASFTQFFSVSSQDLTPQGIAFNSDGTKMFVVGNTGDSVYEYTLSTGFDVSTASFVDSFSVSSEETGPFGVAFNYNGTKMFVSGTTPDTISEYTLTTGFDVSTASFSGVSFSVLSQDNQIEDLAFSSDGTKMFVVGNQNDSVYQYSTGTTAYPNQMDSTALNAITDANQITLGNDLDFAAILYIDSGTTVPTYSGTAINYDANVINQGAVLGTDYNWDFPATDKVRITSLGDYNLKVRII